MLRSHANTTARQRSTQANSAGPGKLSALWARAQAARRITARLERDEWSELGLDDLGADLPDDDESSLSGHVRSALADLDAFIACRNTDDVAGYVDPKLLDDVLANLNGDDALPDFIDPDVLDDVLGDLGPSIPAPAPAPRRRGNFRQKRARNTMRTSRAILGATRVSGPSSAPCATRPFSPDALLPSSPPQPPLSSPARSHTSGRTRGAAPASWKGTNHLDKLSWAGRAIHDTGNAVAWSLNLGPEIEAAAKAGAHPVDYLRKRIANALDRLLGREDAASVPFLFVLGADGNRWHLHGVAAVTEHNLKAFRDALTDAGGRWGAETGREHQVDVRPVYEPDGWSRYIYDHVPAMHRVLDGNAYHIARSVRGGARDLYERERARVSHR